MVKRIGTARRKTRQKLSIPKRERGRIAIRRILSTFNVGDKIALKIDPSFRKGQYFPRFHGLAGEVKSQRGACYEVEITDINKKKRVIVHPAHLKRL